MGRQQHNGASIAVKGEGDPCPRCGQPMQIREHGRINEKQLSQRCYYSRRFLCCNASCRTALVMPERFKVVKGPHDSWVQLTKNEHRIDRADDLNWRAEIIKARKPPWTEEERGRAPEPHLDHTPMVTEQATITDTASLERLRREAEHLKETGQQLAPWDD